MTATSIARCATTLLVGATLMTGLCPEAADAQRRLKTPKSAVQPDSAARAEAAHRDSTEQAAAAAATAGATEGTAAVAPKKPSRLSRAVSATRKATDKVESVTGVSAKDAALLATGVGVGAIAAKKLGMDPGAIAARAMEATGSATQQRAMEAAQRRAAIKGMPGMSIDPSALQAAMGGNAARSVMPGVSEADMHALLAFQQELMQVSLAASQGDAKAQARLEQWAAIGEKYEPELLKLSTTMASTGAADLRTIHRMQAIQFEMMREWSRTTGSSAKAVTP